MSDWKKELVGKFSGSKMTVDSDKLVSWFVQTPPSKNRPFYNWLICFVIIQNDVLYLGGVCTPVYPSLQSSLSGCNMVEFMKLFAMLEMIFDLNNIIWE